MNHVRYLASETADERLNVRVLVNPTKATKANVDLYASPNN